MRYCLTRVCVQQVQLFGSAEEVPDGTEMFFAGGWPEPGVKPVLKFVHHQRRDGVQREGVFFFQPFKKEARCVAVIAVGGFFFGLRHEGKPFFNPFPYRWESDCFVAQFCENAPDVGGLELLIGGALVGGGDLLRGFPEFLGRLSGPGRRFNGYLR